MAEQPTPPHVYFDPTGWLSIAKAIALLGVPSVIAMFLVWILAGSVRDAVLDLRDEIRELRKQTDHHGLVLRQICLHGAKDENDRDACLNGGR